MNPVNRFAVKHMLALLIFLVSLVLGLLVYKDYGISWDEPWQRVIGQTSWQYVFHGNKALDEFKDRDYGVVVELPLVLAEKAAGLTDSRSIFLMRHLLLHLFFLFCAFAFYLLVYVLYRDRAFAACGYLMLLLSPRIYAQSFYNSKDIPFMCMFILCFLMIAIAFRDRKTWNFILLAILSGLLIDTRIMGVPGLVALLTVIDMIRVPGRKKAVLNFLVYLVVTIFVLILFWPWLWEDPAARFSTAFLNMSKFRWHYHMLFFGNFVHSSALKWNYIPQWFGLTTPLLYLFLGITGFFFLVMKFIREPLSFSGNNAERNSLLYLLCFIVSVAAVICFHSVVYDGWRQMYFIYPAFLLLSVYSLASILKCRIIAESLLARTLISLVILTGFTAAGTGMVKRHPFEDIYFNALVSKQDQYLRKTFELDYWGTSYKQALEYIVSNDRSPEIRVMVANAPGVINSMILKPQDRNRIRYVETEDQADYFITNYRWHPQDYPFPTEKKVFTIRIRNSDICSVWKLH
jgi:hypothetical protein